MGIVKKILPLISQTTKVASVQQETPGYNTEMQHVSMCSCVLMHSYVDR